MLQRHLTQLEDRDQNMVNNRIPNWSDCWNTFLDNLLKKNNFDWMLYLQIFLDKLIIILMENPKNLKKKHFLKKVENTKKSGFFFFKLGCFSEKVKRIIRFFQKIISYG